MSNLEFPISLLIAEGRKISFKPVLLSKQSVEQNNQLTSINRAIDILRSKDEEDAAEELKEKQRILKKKYKIIKNKI